MNTLTPAFGFGQRTTGGGAVAPTPITTTPDLLRALARLDGSTTPTVLELAAGRYDFDRGLISVRAQNLTLRAAAGARVVLVDASFDFDLSFCTNVLIHGFVLRTDDEGPEDAIVLGAFDLTRDSGPIPSFVPVNDMRITGCTFAGYRDMAIDIKTWSAQSRLLATIDHCRFLDRRPGEGNFTDRGAIAIGSVGRSDGTGDQAKKDGNSFVTVAHNRFTKIWRRCPRIAERGNHLHSYSNVLQRWGLDRDGRGDDSWNGIEVGNAGEAVIQANAFLPWERKLDKAIKVDNSGVVELTSGRLANVFNGARTNVNSDSLPLGSWYTSNGLTAPIVAPMSDPLQQQIIDGAGAVRVARDDED